MLGFHSGAGRGLSPREVMEGQNAGGGDIQGECELAVPPLIPQLKPLGGNMIPWLPMD